MMSVSYAFAVDGAGLKIVSPKSRCIPIDEVGTGSVAINNTDSVCDHEAPVNDNDLEFPISCR